MVKWAMGLMFLVMWVDLNVGYAGWVGLTYIKCGLELSEPVQKQVKYTLGFNIDTHLNRTYFAQTQLVYHPCSKGIGLTIGKPHLYKPKKDLSKEAAFGEFAYSRCQSGHDGLKNFSS